MKASLKKNEVSEEEDKLQERIETREEFKARMK